MERRDLSGVVKGAAQRLVVNRHRARHRSGERLHEVQEADLKLRQIEQAKHLAGRIMAGDAVRQVQEVGLARPNSAMSEQSSAPHSMAQRVMTRISFRSCWALLSRGSSSSAKQALNRSVQIVPRRIPGPEFHSGGHRKP